MRKTTKTAGKTRKIGQVTRVMPTEHTAKVLVNRLVKHPKYNKQFTLSKSYIVDIDQNLASQLILGDTVAIEEIVPISKRKSWRIVEILKKNKLSDDLLIQKESLENPEPENK